MPKPLRTVPSKAAGILAPLDAPAPPGFGGAGALGNRAGLFSQAGQAAGVGAQQNNAGLVGAVGGAGQGTGAAANPPPPPPAPTGEPPEVELLSEYSWRNFFSTINFLKVLQKMTKHRSHRTFMLQQYKSSVS